MSIPSLFRKKYSEKDLDHKILGRLFVAGDRKWLAGLFKKGEDGIFTLDPDSSLSKDDEKRLKLLAKSVNANRGLFSLPKLVSIAAVIAAVSGGYYLFRNVLVEKALVAGLQAVFQARAEVRGLDFDLFGPRITWTGLTVADRDKPMKNLFELGRTEAGLNAAGLLRARFVVENLEARDVAWNTDRIVPGTLPGVPAAEKQEGPGFLGGLSESVVSSLASFDAKAVLDREYDKLATPATAERLKSEMEGLKTEWSGRSADVRREIDDLKGPVEELTRMSAKSVGSVEEAAALLTKVNSVLPRVRTTVSSAEALKRDFTAASEKASAAQAELTKAVNADYAYAESLVSISGGDAASLARGLFAEYAGRYLGSWYTYGKRGVEIVKNLAADRPDEGEKKPASTRARGRDIPFPVRDGLPRLWIKNLVFSASAGEGQTVEGTAADITGNPGLIGKPAVFAAAYGSPAGRLTIEGSIDARRDAENAAVMSLTTAGFPVRIVPPDPVLTIRSLEGPLDARGTMTLTRKGGMEGRLDGALLSPAVERSGRGDRVSDLAYSVLTGASRVDAAARFSVSPGGGTDMRISSSLDAAVREGLRGYLREQEARYKARIREELGNRFAAVLAENATLQAGFSEVEKAVGGNLTDAGAYRKAAEEKKKEIEKRVEDLKKQAADNLLRRLPSTPSIPRF